jgi:UDP-N-acetylmuramoyl-tripeptide--D-alanyl-D-alanine ligase
MMRAMTGQEVRQAVRGRWVSRNQPLPIRGVSVDSRTAKPDDLFIAIRGEHFDGHDFIEQAASAGCVAAVVSLLRVPEQDVLERFPAGVIAVEDARAALLDLGAFYRSVIPATVVGITGSNGKTTVKRMADHILAKRHEGTSSPKNFNNEIGVPLTLLSAGAGDDYVLCEMGTNAPGEIARLTRAVKPNIAVITNIGQAHLEKLPTLDHIAVEKASILGWLGQRDIAVVNADSPHLDHALKSYEKRMIRFGTAASAHLRLTGYECDGRTQQFQVNDRDCYDLPIPGKHNALNALAAMAIAARFGFQQEDAGRALADFSGVPMRLERIDAGAIGILNDTYNANPASLSAAVDVLNACKAPRRVMIVGDMLELGEKAEELHARLGRELAARRVDLIIGVGSLGARFAQSAQEAGKDTRLSDTPAELVPQLGEIIRPGDLVLLKGSRAMGMETLVEPLVRIGRELQAGKEGQP